MQISYSVNPDRAVEGMPIGDRESVPRLLPLSYQVTTLTVANPQAGANVLSVTDVASGQVYELSFTSTAATATTVDAIVAAAAINGEFRNLFSVVDTSSTVATATAKHAGREYTFELTTAFGTTTVTPADTVEHDASSSLSMGRMVCRGSGDGEISALGASTSLQQLEGIVFRTDANHFHDLEELPSDSDVLAAGKYLSVMQKGRLWVQVEDAVTPASSVFVRRAQTSSVGAVGRFRGSAAGGQQSYTFTPSAINLPGYGFEFDYQGVHYTALYLGDGSTTVAQACDGLVQDLGSISGLTISDGATEVTIQTAAGTELENVRNLASHTDVPVDSVDIAESVGEDIDTIDVSSICSFETSASAGGLALLRINA